MTARGATRVPSQPARIAFWGRVLVSVIGFTWSMTLVVDFRVALTVLLVIGFAMAAIGIKYPLVGLVGIGMLCTLNEIAAPLLLTGGLWRFNTVSYWLLLVTLIFRSTLLSAGRSQNRILLPFILLLGLEILLSPDPASGVQQVFAVVAVLGLLIYCSRAGLDPDAWYWLGVVTGVLGAGGGLAFLRQQDALPYINHNVWPFLMLTGMLTICLAFVVTVDAPGRQRVLALLAVINGTWVFLSGARGNLAIALVCLAFVFVMMRLRRVLVVAIMAALIGTFTVSQFPELHESTVARLRVMLDSRESFRNRTSGRTDIALGGWYIFTEHPLGAGTGAFATSWAQVSARIGSAYRRGREFSAMSGWVKVLAENGVPGVILMGAYTLSFTVTGWRTRKPELFRLGLLVSGVLTVAWISNEFQNKALWFLAAGATMLLDGNFTREIHLHANAIARR